MSSSSSSELDAGENSELLYIVNFLKEHPVIIDKSQVPSVKVQKDNATEKLKHELENKFGKVISVKNILKKINNLKAAIKKKTDTNRTGNHKIKLSPAEQVVFAVMNGANSDNPVLNKIPGHIEAGPSSATTVVMPKPPPKTKKHPKEKREMATSSETEETKKISNSELQRLVLLEQLSYFRYKNKQLRQEMGENSGVTSTITKDGEKELYSL